MKTMRVHHRSSKDPGAQHGSQAHNIVSKIENHGRKPEKPGKPGRRPEFDPEYEGRVVKLTLHNGTTVIGRAETSKYWLKMVSASGKCIYVNKAYVVLIEPAE